MKNLEAKLPAYAKDLRLNLAQLPAIESLSEERLWGTLVASAHSAGDGELLREVVAQAADHLSPEALEAAKGAAALMGMNNVYYRFVHLASNGVYGELPARLRMQGLRNHGVEQATFELWALAVSAVNGCGMCIDAHERVLSREGVTSEAIQDAVRIASVVHAVAGVLAAERALAVEVA